MIKNFLMTLQIITILSLFLLPKVGNAQGAPCGSPQCQQQWCFVNKTGCNINLTWSDVCRLTGSSIYNFTVPPTGPCNRWCASPPCITLDACSKCPQSFGLPNSTVAISKISYTWNIPNLPGYPVWCMNCPITPPPGGIKITYYLPNSTLPGCGPRSAGPEGTFVIECL